ncbi:MAG: hypothetical protein KDK27_20435 [Leptospiraceae bacterium]|nr:hypothetical protein [Leptospiraceae bacterium]
MLYILVKLRIHADRLSEFEEYEERALSILRKHGGNLLYRLRPAREARTNNAHGFLDAEQNTEMITEIHLLHFPDYDSFQRYGQCPEKERLQAERDLIIAHTDIQLCNALQRPPF